MANISPVFNAQIFDANGAPLVGGKIFTYIAGSSTKQSTFTDESGSVAQTNPIILNALGYPTNGPIWLADGQSYKLVLAPADDTDPPTSPIKTFDDIQGVVGSVASIAQFQPSGATPTYTSTTTFTVLGDQTTEMHIGRRVQCVVDAGSVYGSIASSVFTTLTTVTLLMDGSQVLDSGLSAVNLSILRADHLATPFANAPETIVGQKTFEDSPKIPDATAPDEPVAKGQMLSLHAQGSLIGIQVFTASGTYTKATNNPSFVIVEVQGAGGPGGGSTTTGSVGGGGAAGGWGMKRINSADLSASETVTVGAGGTPSTGTGTTGGTSSFGSHLSATGGTSGAGASSVSSFSGGTGGISTGGDINCRGACGFRSIANSATSGISSTGEGGASKFGGNGSSVTNSANLPGGAAQANSGSGGGGASAGAAAQAGGAAGDGIIIVYEYA